MKIAVIENPRPLTMEHYNDVANAPLSASLNSGYALAVARRAGWVGVYVDLTSNEGNAECQTDIILAAEADLILFHWVYAWGHEQTVCDTMTLLRRFSNAPIGAFGLFPTMTRERLMQYAPPLDFVLTGEFEVTLGELLLNFRSSTELPRLPGLLLRDVPYASRPLLEDISSLPLPVDVGNNCSYPNLNIAASRGCFGSCSFCFIHGYYGCSRRRIRSVESLAQELELRLSRREINSLYFIDPTFIGHGNDEHERILKIGQTAQQFRLPFGFETRADTVNMEIMSKLAAYGADTVFLGIESGCDSVLQRIGKRISTKQIRRAIRIVRDCGLKLNLGFIMFEPDTTLAELGENFAFLGELGLLEHHELTANLLYHNQIVLYGSGAWERFAQEGRLLLEERFPFEARYRFRDDRIAMVSAAMGRLSAEYFRGISALRGSTGAGEQNCDGDKRLNISTDNINGLLKEAFLTFCAAAVNPSRQGLTIHEGLYIHSLQQLLAVPPYASA